MSSRARTADSTAPNGRSLEKAWTARSSALAVGLVCLAILTALAPHLLLVANTPTGGDMGAHVLGPAYLRDVLLPSGRIMGWSNSWFAGFPIFYFYFPLPSLVIVGLDLLLPYGVAFKLVSVMGLVALAPACYFLVRSMGFARPVAAIAAAAGGAYAFMETPTPNIFGGTIASSLAGEFSYSWSFAFSLVYLGYVLKAVYDSKKYFVRAGVVLALTALCHVIPTIGVVVASLFVVVSRSKWWRSARGREEGTAPEEPVVEPRARLWGIVAGTWLLGFVLAAFWALPLVIRLGYTTDMDWQPLAGLDELVPVELWPIAVLGLIGIVAALRFTNRAIPLAALTLLPLPAFFLLGQGAKLWNGRALPHWFFGLHVFAGIAVGLLAARAARALPERISRWWVRGGLALILLALLLGPNVGGGSGDSETATGLFAWPGWEALGLESVISRISRPDLLVLVAGGLVIWLVGRSGEPKTGVVVPFLAVVLFIGAVFLGTLTTENYVSAWARWNFQGYEGKEEWTEYRSVMSTMAALPPGRVQWEANSELNKYGTPMSPMLFPYWTEGSHPSMEGLYFESSVTTPFHFLNASELSSSPSNPIPGLSYHNGDVDRGARHMSLFNVAYYVSYTDTATEKADQHPSFRRLAESAPFTIFALPESSLVDVASNRPWVFEEPAARLVAPLVGIFKEKTEPHFVDVALDWYEDLDMLDQWIVAGGPDAWERVTTEMEGTTVPLEGGGEVSDVVLEDHRISFRTTAVGVPHLVKVSYFPNWTATGADGPWRVAPAFMVVVPTHEQVELRFEKTWVEKVGAWASLGGLVLLLAWWAATTLRGRRGTGLGSRPYGGLRDPSLRGTGRHA